MLLTTHELAERWKVSDNTLRKWRVQGTGPSYVKFGEGRAADVRYRIEDVEAWEKQNLYITEAR